MKNRWKRVFFGVLWCYFSAMLLKLPVLGKDITNEFAKLPFNDFQTFLKIFNFITQHITIYATMLLSYVCLYPLIVYLIPIYLLWKKRFEEYDTALFSIALTTLVFLGIYNIFYVKPPRFYYDLNVFPFDEEIKDLRNPKFVFPSFHVAIPFLITLSTKDRRIKIVAFLSTIVIAFSTILLLMHWIYDVLASVAISILISVLVKNNLKKLEKVYNYLPEDEALLKKVSVLLFSLFVFIVIFSVIF